MAVQTPSPPPIVAPPAGPVGPPRPPNQRLEETVELAGWGRRFSAWLTDWIILIVPLSVVGGLLSGPLGDPTGEGVGILLGLVLIPVAFVYFAVLNGRGKTVGKRLLGITVVDAQTFSAIGGGKGAVRELVRLGLGSISFGLLFLVDGLWPLWDERVQSLHDKAANSIVVRDPKGKPALLTETSL
jgi:uncharacterized RDD family membrane protein YckC